MQEQDTDAEVQVEVELEEEKQEKEVHEQEASAGADTLHSEAEVAPGEVGTSGLAAVRHTRLPMSRIKSIMKQDPDVGLASAEAVFLVTRATELLLETIAKEAYTYTAKNKKKTITKKDLDTVIDTVDCLCFLDGAMDF